tara:strand:- start:96 stop:308 length:213 start_codon:yes stop_codon:yes gene_type:complete
MKKDMIYPTEKSVLKDMKENNIEEMDMFITTYVDHSNYQQYGYTINNINSDYYFNQKCIENKTQRFSEEN